MAPQSFSLDTKSDFNHAKDIALKLALKDAGAFHVLLAAGASDIAALYGRKDSEAAIKHRSMSIALVKRRLSLGEATDGALGAIALLAGNEVSDCRFIA